MKTLQAHALIDTLVEAYNGQNARAFADCFSEEAFHGTLRSDAPQRGREEIFRFYLDVFARYPFNRTEVCHRVVVGPWVVDCETVTRAPESQPFDVVAIYELKDGRIVRFDMVRA
jgi:uncharacterized protein (TIGR02246 family)